MCRPTNEPPVRILPGFGHCGIIPCVRIMGVIPTNPSGWSGSAGPWGRYDCDRHEQVAVRVSGNDASERQPGEFHQPAGIAGGQDLFVLRGLSLSLRPTERIWGRPLGQWG